MPLQATSGAASYDAFGGGVPVVPNYIEDVFSTWLYTGNETVNTITNGIDLSGKGGMVWIKSRNSPSVPPHRIFDTVRGVSNGLSSNTTAAQGGTGNLSSFNSTGFGLNTNRFEVNEDGFSFASWTFREQPKFFDVVTYTGNGTAGRTVAHNLGSVPGCILVKCTSTTSNWRVYHRSLANTNYLQLNLTTAQLTNSAVWNSTTPTSTEFTLGTDSAVNDTGATYVAYLFAHDDGGFGLTGTDNVISCGSYTGNGATNTNAINLGYEPQWVLIKRTDSAGIWCLHDTMRGMPAFSSGVTDAVLMPQASDAEFQQGNLYTTSTGFTLSSQAAVNASGSTYIYIAIRRGPMAVPTLGTSVFKSFYTNSTSGTAQTTNFPVDWQWGKPATGAANFEANTRLLGVSTLPTYTTQPALFPNTTASTSNGTGQSYNWTNTSFGMPDPFGGNQAALWAWRRAPSYFDVVAYTGTGSSMTISHNLGVSPELIIGKTRSNAVDWNVSAFLSGFTDGVTSGFLNASNRFDPSNADSFFDPVSSTTFTHNPNTSARTYVAYLFATCAGVSKVGSYTGTGALQTVACGFTTGARFLLIKRTDDVGDWYIWDSARGISSGNDPYFVISTANEVTGTNYVDTDTTGFKVTAAASTTVNISAATYIFLAIA